MNIRYRHITDNDAEQVARLTLQLGYNAPSGETTMRIMEITGHPDHCAFVAHEQETIIGWIHGFHTLRLESDPFVEIGGLVVDENHRGKGIGKALVDQVKAWARERGVATVRVRCNTTRTETHRFYEQLGFRETKEQKVFAIPLT